MGIKKTAIERELDQIRQQMSRTLMKALREGRLEEEIRSIDAEGRKAWREMMNGHTNGHKSRRK